MRMCCACLGVQVISQHCCRQDKTLSVAPFSLVCLLFFGFFPFRFFCLSMSGHCGRRRGCLAVPSSGVPAAASTIVAAPGLAGAGPHGPGGRPSPSTVVASTPPASVAESFSRDDLLALVRDEFARLMQQQQANPSLTVSLAPPG